MSKEHFEVLGRVFCSVLERMAFMFGEAAEAGDLPDTVADPVKASISFEGPIRGTLLLAIPREMCSEVAANSLGMDAGDPEAVSRGEDAFKELINVLCGNVLTEVAGDEVIFDLSIPEMKATSESDWKALQEDENTALFLVDDYPALVQFNIQ